VRRLDDPTLHTSPTPSFERLLVEHQGSILGFIKSIIPDHHEAEDLLQRTNLVLWSKRDNFEPGTNFRAWAFSIARFETLNQLKRQRRERRILSEHPAPEAGAYSEAHHSPAQEEVLDVLRSCLGGLSARDRELVLARYSSDLTLEQYATTLNRSAGTLKARLFKIREDLRKTIARRLHTGGRVFSPVVHS